MLSIQQFAVGLGMIYRCDLGWEIISVTRMRGFSRLSLFYCPIPFDFKNDSNNYRDIYMSCRGNTELI